MSTEYNIVCYTCKETGPSFASASIAYGYKIWNTDEVYKWLGHREAVGKHEGHDLRIVHEQADLPWENDSNESHHVDCFIKGCDGERCWPDD